MVSTTLSHDAPVGIFDSGVGGLSVLRHIQAQLPHEHLLYVADSGYAPYGDKPEALVIARVLAIADFLIAQGAKAIVVACNTATVAAVRVLRETHPGMPVVGVEPGLKPAAALTRSGKVGVLATARTLQGAKFLLLRDQIHRETGVDFLLQPCVGLVDQIELGELNSSGMMATLDHFIAPLLAQEADTLVLGCTHYPLVRGAIERLLVGMGRGDVALVDTGDAVARQLARLLVAGGLARTVGTEGLPASLTGYTTASAVALTAAFRSLLGIDPPVYAVNIAEPQAPSASTCN
ncbi:glutamate racemase [Massilia aurea]|jgi:glutamate racemase|uniref:Glutamate racemase n=1 Tax=Massilia aurea TaxID=373040 RepID=A0A7W9WWU8_9BURK|nr:glutamate racemase [Massilia aurea]MBB6132033.1 glutamate racemase [Massilia aurea]